MPDELKQRLASQLNDWNLVTVNGIERLMKDFTVPDFAAAMRLSDAIGNMAEEQMHHPAMLVEWGRVTVSWWTHIIGGLHMNDFVCAAKTDDLYSEQVYG